MSQIARLSGKSQSLIHHHFGTKQGLYEAVKERFGQQFGQILIPLLAGTHIHEDFIRVWSREYFHFWKTRPNLMRIMLWRQLEIDNSPWEATLEIYRYSVEKIIESQQMGFINPELNPSHIISALSGVHLSWLNNKPDYCTRNGLDPDDPAVDENYLKDIETIFLKGIMTKK